MLLVYVTIHKRERREDDNILAERETSQTRASVHGESFGVSPSFDTESQDEVQDKSVQDESVTNERNLSPLSLSPPPLAGFITFHGEGAGGEVKNVLFGRNIN
jgi:hypothetical protein